MSAKAVSSRVGTVSALSRAGASTPFSAEGRRDGGGSKRSNLLAGLGFVDQHPPPHARHGRPKPPLYPGRSPPRPSSPPGRKWRSPRRAPDRLMCDRTFRARRYLPPRSDGRQLVDIADDEQRRVIRRRLHQRLHQHDVDHRGPLLGAPAPFPALRSPLRAPSAAGLLLSTYWTMGAVRSLDLSPIVVRTSALTARSLNNVGRRITGASARSANSGALADPYLKTGRAPHSKKA